MPTEWISRDAVFAALDMNAVLTHYDITPGRGSSYRINCPFHDDERPSCSINPAAKVYNCFGCGSQGNVLDFIAAMDGLDAAAEFRAVLEIAITIIGHNPTDQNERPPRRAAGGRPAGKAKDQHRGRPTDKNAEDNSNSNSNSNSNDTTAKASAKLGQSRKRRKEAKVRTPPDLNATEHIEPNAPLEPPAFPLKLERQHPYLDARGFDQALLDEFGIGFEPRANALMAGRICFPVHNASGQLVAYAGRWASDDTDANGDLTDAKGKVQERYKLPKGFRKAVELYNLHRVIQNHPGGDTVVLVEGFWSVLRLSALTIPVLGLMGRSISPQQMLLLKQHSIRNIVLMLDGDDEGRIASEEALMAIAPHFYVREVLLPEGTKPDDVDEYFLRDLRDELFVPITTAVKPVTAPNAPPAHTGAGKPASTDHNVDTAVGTVSAQYVVR